MACSTVELDSSALDIILDTVNFIIKDTGWIFFQPGDLLLIILNIIKVQASTKHSSSYLSQNLWWPKTTYQKMAHLWAIVRNTHISSDSDLGHWEKVPDGCLSCPSDPQPGSLLHGAVLGWPFFVVLPVFVLQFSALVILSLWLSDGLPLSVLEMESVCS